MSRLFFGVLVVACAFASASRQAQCSEPAPQTSYVEIYAEKIHAPLSKYVYGQFIEHLGRCIYGGIWAEMLEDRKFFYPVGSKESPWRIVGPSGLVPMDRQKPFVGDHTPQILLTGDGQAAGIVQGQLGLRKGKGYIGRIWLAGDSAAPVTVSLVWGNGQDQRQTVTIDALTAEYAKTPLQFTAGGDTDAGRLEIRAAGSGSFHVGTVSLMPADNVHGMRADTLELLKQLDAPVYRWPGGNFVSGYNWRDGIGDPDRRPPRKNPAWQGIEHNDFGLDEFMLFCRLLKTEPYVAVNSGLGDSRSAVAEIEYANAPADRPGGQLRAKNGHRQPYGVRWWSIGNEMFGDWQLGYMGLEKYIPKNNEFAKAMRAADPSIKLIAVGAAGPWSEGMLRKCADSMDLMSEHFYCGENPNDLAAHVRQIPDNIRRIAAAHRDYRKRLDSLRGKDIRIAMDEWNYWYGPEPYGQIGCPYHLKDALGIAAGLHEYARQSDIVFMANYAQTVNVIGCIKTSKTAACFDTTGVVLKLYRKYFGVIPVDAECKSPTPLDVAAAWTADRKAFTIGIVNPTMKPVELSLNIVAVMFKGHGLLKSHGAGWQIAGTDPMAHNAPGKQQLVKIEELPPPRFDRYTGKAGGLASVTVAPCSVTLLRFDAE
jgi:alpha-L-arabinofuranosidase